MKRGFLFCLLLFLLGLSGCRDENVALNRVGALMQSSPDSALMLLQKIDFNSVVGEKARARYALLYSEALDKNYIDLQSDSLINIALDYYMYNGSDEEKFHSLYYRGRIEQNRGDWISAISFFLRAQEYLSDLTDYRMAGMLYAQSGRVYSEYYDYPKALKAYENALEYYKKSGIEKYIRFAHFDIALIRINMRDGSCDQGEEVLLETMDWAYENDEQYLLLSCVETLCQYYQTSTAGGLEKLRKLLSGKYVGKCMPTKHIEYARKFLEFIERQNSSAQSYFNYAWKNASSIFDSLLLYNQEYNLYKELRQYEVALDKYEKVEALHGKILRKVIEQPVLSVQNEYYRNQSLVKEIELEKNRIIGIIVSILLCMAIFILCIVHKYRISKKEIQIRDYIELYKDLKELFNVRENQMEKQLSVLFKKQYELLNKLAVTMYETQGINKDKDFVYRQIKAEIESISSFHSKDEYQSQMAQLEDIINEYKNNVIAKFKSDFPGLKKSDLYLMCYICAGFSGKAISLFTGDSVKNIYTKKSRLKSMIMESNSINKELFIEMM